MHTFSLGTLKTAALLMRAIDRKNYHTESLEFIEKLKEYDPHRRGYYQDLCNKWSIEDRLEDWIEVVSINRDAAIDLSDLKLINLHYQQYLCVASEIDLGDNQFRTRHIIEIRELFDCCNVLKYTLDAASGE